MSKPSNDLPDEILNLIFLKLPLKSIGKCKCLSKSWNSRLSTSQFTNSLLDRNYPQKQTSLFLITTPSRSLQTIHTPFNHDDDVLSTKIEFQHDTWAKVTVVGSCNGLVLLANEEDALCLINPLTTQKVYIPEFDLALEKCPKIRKHGFGFDTLTNDYKIVELSWHDPRAFASKYTRTFVDVYSVNNRVWKRFGIFPYTYIRPELTTGVFVNGAVHWLTYRMEAPYYPCMIVAFDLAREVFSVIKPPFTCTSICTKLLVRGGCLCVAESNYGSTPVVWTMEEYGMAESWRKLVIPVNDVWIQFQSPSCFVGEEQVVLVVTKEERLVIYDVKDETTKGILVDGVPALCKDACIFEESLVPVG